MGGDETAEAQRLAEPVPHDRKYGLAGDHGNAAAHFHVDDDAGGPKDDGPQQSVPERGACLKRKDDLPEIHEAAERRHDSKRDAEQFPHAWKVSLKPKAIW